MKKRMAMISVVLTLILCLNCLPAIAMAAVPYGGICGENLQYKLLDGVLTIQGTGPMYDYTDVEKGETAPWFGQNKLIREIIVEEGVTHIGSYSFNGLANVTAVSLPNTVTTIGATAFAVDKSLETLKLPEGLTSIGAGAFSAAGLTEVTIPDSVNEIGKECFANCKQLKTAKVSNGVTVIPYRAFAYCGELETVDMRDDAVIKKQAFLSCEKLDPIAFVEPLGDVQADAFGEQATLTVRAEGKGLTYTWYYKNQGEDTFTKSCMHGVSYSIEMTKARFNRQMYCVVKDRYGKEKRTRTARMTCAEYPITISQDLSDIQVDQAEALATLRVVAKGSGLTYKWFYKNANMRGFSQCSNQYNRNSYSIRVTEARYGRQMYCVVRDKYGNQVQTASAMLTYTK